MTDRKKRFKKEVGRLTEKAYRSQLENELSKLSKSFDDWPNKEIDCFELTEKIHQFHDGASRELWKCYNYTKDQKYLIAVAIVEGQLLESEISKELLDELQPVIQFCKEQLSE